MPVQVSYPGVYVEEVPSGVHTIAGVSTSVAAFVDFFREGPMNEAVQIFGMTDFNRVYGGLDDRSEASYAINQFFLNGGTEAHVVRVASGTDANPPEPKKASVEIMSGTNTGAKVVATVGAKDAGLWGNNLRLAGRPAALSAKTIAAKKTHTDRKIRRERPLRSSRVVGVIRDPILGPCYT